MGVGPHPANYFMSVQAAPLLQVHPWKITAEMAIANSPEGGLQ